MKRVRRPPPAATLTRPDILGHEKLAPVPSQRRSRIKREAILGAGVELFERNGYEATAIGDIARRSGTSVGGFYQYFRSKRQLLLVLMNELLQKLEHIDMQPSGEGNLRSAIESVLFGETEKPETAHTRAIAGSKLLDAVKDRVRQGVMETQYEGLRFP